MAENEITSLNLLSLEQEYSKTLWEIQNTKKRIVDLLTFQVTIENEDDTDNFIWKIKKSIKSLDKQVTESDLSKELTEKNNYLKKITQELEKRRKELFDNFDATLIPLDKLSVIESFLSDYKKSEYKEKVEQQIKMAKIVEMQQLNMNTLIKDFIYELDIQNNNYQSTGVWMRTYNCLKAADIETLWDLIQYYKENGEKWFFNMRNLGKKSVKQIIKFLKENKFID